MTEGNFGGCGKLHTLDWLLFLGSILFLKLRLVLKLSDVCVVRTHSCLHAVNCFMFLTSQWCNASSDTNAHVQMALRPILALGSGMSAGVGHCVRLIFLEMLHI